MKIKITKWEDLDGKENKDYRLFVSSIIIAISKERNYSVSSILPRDNSMETVIEWVKAFGFSVEFTEPIKLTKEEWHFVRAFRKGKVTRDDVRNRLNIFMGKIKKDEQIGIWLRDDDEPFYSINSLFFPHITWESEPWSIESLRELECEEEI